MSEKPLIIVSAVRFFQSGSIVIVNDCLAHLSKYFSDKYSIKALVYKKELYAPLPNIEFIEFPEARKNIFYRLYYEYFYFRRFSKKHQPLLWFSMQDSTPNVQAKIQSLYFHNSLLLYPKPLLLLRLQPRIFFLRLLYKTIYTRGIRKNNFVIVQQESLANFLQKKYSVSEKNILLFPPQIEVNLPIASKSDIYTFIYPATAFAYKNFEIIFNACESVNKKNPNYKILLTVSEDENKYIRSLKSKHSLPQISFIGFIKREELLKLYSQCDCLVFPSLTESWGLPLSEFAVYKKPILCADLSYAKETLHDYDKAKFFDPYNAEMFAEYMLQAINNELVFDKSTFKHSKAVIENWQELFDKILPTSL